LFKEVKNGNIQNQLSLQYLTDKVSRFYIIKNKYKP